MSWGDSCYTIYTDDAEEEVYEPKTLTEIIVHMQLDRAKVFKEQDHEKGHFDCEIDIRKKKIYCHKFVLAVASETFNALLSDRWNKTNENVIKIDNPEYTYDCFFELLCFLYSGECKINDENLFVLTDMAEYYGIEYFKDYCKDYLSKMEITVENIEENFDFCDKYSIETTMNDIRNFININFKDIIETPQFFQYKKPFLEFIAMGIAFSNEHKFFDAIYEWAERQAMIKKAESKDKNYNVYECIKNELTGIITKLDFSEMKFEFIKKSVLSKRFLFSVSKLYIIIAKCERNYVQEEECFKTLYEIAENEVKDKQKTRIDNDRIDMNAAIKAELIDVLQYIRFHVMPTDFLMDFVVEKLFDFSLVEVHNFLKNSITQNSEEEAFTAVYKIAEKQVSIQQQNSPDTTFNLISAVKMKLNKVFLVVKYYQMRYDFLMNFLVEKGLLLSPFDLFEYYNSISEIYTTEYAFKSIYKLAEKQVLHKQKLSLDSSFDLFGSMKDELAYVFPKVKFYEMNVDFLNNFVVANRVISAEEAKHVYDVCVEVENDDLSICGSLKDIYGIMEAMEAISSNYMPIIWNEYCLCRYKIFNIPKTPSTVIKKKGVDWYLCFESDGCLFVKHETIINTSDYLIAEMKPKFNGKFMFNTRSISQVSAHYKNV